VDLHQKEKAKESVPVNHRSEIEKEAEEEVRAQSQEGQEELIHLIGAKKLFVVVQMV